MGKAHAKLLSWGIEALPWMAELLQKGNYDLLGPFVEISGFSIPAANEQWTLKERVEGFLLIRWKDQTVDGGLVLPEVSAAKLK